MEFKRRRSKSPSRRHTHNLNPWSVNYKIPPLEDLADLVNYIPHLISNLIVSYNVVENCFQDKLVYLFQKCLIESKFEKDVERIPVPGASEWQDDELDAYEETVKQRFNFSNNLNPYDYVSSVLEDADYHGEFYVTKNNKMLFIPHPRKKKKGVIDPALGPENDVAPGISRDLFARRLDGFHFVWFLNRLQTFTGKETHNQIICMQHLKSIALFTSLIDIPVSYIRFLFEETVDRFLRSLAVYFQYYLQLWEVAIIRTEMRKTKLFSLKSAAIEKLWETNLNDMRFFIARNYIIMILGAKRMQNYHHLNVKFSISGSDIVNYELLYCFSAQIMMMIFNHENDLRRKKIILDQINKLFRVPEPGAEDPYDIFSPSERAVLEGKFVVSGLWKSSTPCLLEVKRPGRDVKVLHCGANNIIVTKNKRIRALQSALLVPEDRLEVANIKLGILGKPRADFPPLLNCTRITPFERNDGIPYEEETVNTGLPKGESYQIWGIETVKWEKPILVTKEFPDKPYNTDYSLLINRRQDKESTIKMWKRYALASDRFWYRIDCNFTVVDSIKKKFLKLFEEQVREKADFEKRIKSLIQKIKRP